MSETPAGSGIQNSADVSVIMVSYNTAHLLERLFTSLQAGKGTLKLQLIVVDNASRDNSVDFIRSYYPDAELIANSTNVGFARAYNQPLSGVR